MRSTNISILALAAEGILFLLGAAWISIQKIPINIALNYTSVIYVIEFLFFLFFINILVFQVSKLFKETHLNLKNFYETWVVPLANDLSFAGSLIVAISSGIGEEVFFRGALNQQLGLVFGNVIGLIIGSVIFAYVHFIKLEKDLYFVFLLYCFVGLCFSYIYFLSNNLLIPIISHSLYNFIVLNYIKLKKTYSSGISQA